MIETKDPELFALLPHRPPMLLLDKVLAVDSQNASASLTIQPEDPFYLPGLGVPAPIAIEYMGQTAALIAGHQKKTGMLEPHLGFLLGSRKFEQHIEYFTAGQELVVQVDEGTIVDQSLANFNCRVFDNSTQALLCQATLSVFRTPLSELKP